MRVARAGKYRLYDVNAMKFDEYELKTGLKSPIYIDFRVLVSHPALMNELTVAATSLADNPMTGFCWSQLSLEELIQPLDSGVLDQGHI
uniref:Uncharacterized protein n=1 Tax=Fundulus heteroclitus TaxID=8078 RepID=A0A3Q2NVE5_FUNHE